MLKRVFWHLMVCAFGLVLAVELGARLFLQLPLYVADDEIGYALRPNQRGDFAGNHWTFNDKGMGVDANFEPAAGLDVLLVGDSLVFGGSELDQSERLGEMLSHRTSSRVWPLAAGSWSLLNELRAIERASAIRHHVEVVIFVLNSGDFNNPSHWNNNNTHPVHFPALYSAYIINRYIFKIDDGLSDIQIKTGNFEENWIAFIDRSKFMGTNVYVVGYSQQEDGLCPWIPDYISRTAKVSCFNANELRLKNGMRDDIHPNYTGNKILVEFLATRI